MVALMANTYLLFLQFSSPPGSINFIFEYSFLSLMSAISIALEDRPGCSKLRKLNEPVKCFTTLYPNTLKFFVEKMREAPHIFSTKNISKFQILMFEILTK